MIFLELAIILLVIIVLGSILFFRLRRKSISKTDKLWKECRNQLRMPSEQADKTIERHINRLKEKHPDRSQEWYLEKILYDLERDR